MKLKGHRRGRGSRDAGGAFENGRLRVLLGGVGALAAFCVAGAAQAPLSHASSVAVEGSTIVYRAAPGEANHLTVNYDDGARRDSGIASYYFGEHTALVLGGPGVAIQPGPGCRRVTAFDEQGQIEVPYEVECSPLGVTAVRVDLADGDDGIVVYGGGVASSSLPFPVPTRVDGGSGADQLFVDQNTESRSPWPQDDRVDGGPGNDTIMGGSVIAAGDGDDRVELYPELAVVVDGGAGNDEINGTNGDDVLVGGDGHDTIEPRPGRDKVSGGAGDDRILAKGIHPTAGGFLPDRDEISCGEGRDTLEFDQLDVIAADCERGSSCSLTAVSPQRATREGMAIRVLGGTSGCKAVLKTAKLKIGRKVFAFVKKRPQRAVAAGQTWRLRLAFGKSTLEQIKRALKRGTAVSAKAQFDLDGVMKSTEMRIR